MLTPLSLFAKRCLTRALALCATSLIASSASADSTWNNSAGGDMATAANWTGGLPTGGAGVFNISVTGPLTLSSDLTMQGLQFNKDGALFSLDLGADRTLTVNGNANTLAGTSTELKSGTIRMSDNKRFFIGDNCSSASFTVNGSSSALYSGTATGGNNFIQVGSANSNLDSHDNRLVVTNGGLVNGWVILGRLSSNGNREFSGRNDFIVTGSGSRFVSELMDFTIGACQGLAECLIDDHATASVSKSIYLGQDWTGNYDVHWAGSCNRLVVTNGATLTTSSSLGVGHCSSSNRVEIADGARVTANGLYTSMATNVNIRSGAAPGANSVTVRGNGSLLKVSEFVLGKVERSWNDEIDIDGGCLESGGRECFVGCNGTGHRLRVASGGRWCPKYFTSLGAHDRSNTLEVAASGTVIVSNQFRHTANSRYDGAANGWNTLWIHGADANFKVCNGQPYHVGRFGISVGDAIKIEDGGTFTGESDGICIPYSQATNAYAKGFCLSVTGANSKFVQSDGTFVFAYALGHAATNVDCRIHAADGGALLFTNTACFFGNGNDERSSVSVSNLVHIAQGGSMVHYSANKHNVILGNWTGAEDNRLLIEGTVLCTNTGSFFSDSVYVTVGQYGSRNTLEVANGGRLTISGPTLLLGYYAAARDNRLIVRDGATLELNRAQWMDVGRQGSHAGMRVDNATVDATNICRICVGASESASNATIAVCNNALLTVPRIVVGDGARDCTLVVSNATLNICPSPLPGVSYAGCLQIGYGTTGSNATLLVSGKAPRIRCSTQLALKNAGSSVVFDIPRDGYAATPISTCGFTASTAGVKIRVRLPPNCPMDGRDVPLVELDEGRSFGDMSNVTYDLPEGVRMRIVNSRYLVARLGNRGLSLILR